MSVQPSAPPAGKRPAMTMHSLMKMLADGEKITMLTAYDASFAAVADLAGVEIILVGDSLGMVCQGHNSTLPVTLDDMRYHVECVARGLQKQNGRPLVLGDMPFGSYATPEQAFRSASVLMQAGAHMVKLEGGAVMVETVRFLVRFDPIQAQQIREKTLKEKVAAKDPFSHLPALGRQVNFLSPQNL